MLTQTFVHVPGIGRTTERSLWHQGCPDWDTFLQSEKRFSVGSASRELARREIDKSRAALTEGNHQFFAKRLKARDAWRAYESFKESCVYLDIETENSEDEPVTAIGLYDGSRYECLLKGEDLESFRDKISHYSMIVTFCGIGFDLPVLQKRFPGLVMDQIHLDLCPLLRHLGYRGGLKKIEREFGITRSEETDGLNGLDAVRLWRAYRRGNESALDVFVQYNKEDTVNMKVLAERAFELMKAHVESSPLPQNGSVLREGT